MHDCFASAGAEGGIELVAVVEGEVVPRKGLAAVFVDSLEDLWVGVFSYLPRRGFLFVGVIPCSQQRSRDQGRER